MLGENGDVLRLCKMSNWLILEKKKKKGSEDFPRNIMLSSTTAEAPLGYEAAPATIKQMTQVFHSNYRSSVK